MLGYHTLEWWHGWCPRNMFVPYMLYQISPLYVKPFGHRLGPNDGDAGAPPLGMGHGWPPKNTLLLTCVTVPNLVILSQTVSAYLRRSSRKFWPLTPGWHPLSRSLKVNGTDTDQLAAYDFLKCSTVTIPFPRKMAIFRKIACPPLVFNTTTEGSLGIL